MNEQRPETQPQRTPVRHGGASNVLIDNLRQAVADRQVVAIVGAGVAQSASGNVPAASWVGLLHNGIDRCVGLNLVTPEQAADMRTALGSGQVGPLPAVAEEVTARLGGSGGGEYGLWLRESVGTLTVEEPAVIEALRDLNVPLATTNYDGLLEDVTGWRPVTWHDRVRVERVLRGAEPGVLHLHGHWETPESVVLGLHSYDQVTADLHAQAVLRTLRMTHSLLFVGFGAGLADPNLGALLQWSRDVFAGSEYRNFRLARASEVQTLQEQHPSEERVFVVAYGENHEDLAPFLRSIGASGDEAHKGVAVAASSPPLRALTRSDESCGSVTGTSVAEAEHGQSSSISGGTVVDADRSSGFEFESDQLPISSGGNAEGAQFQLPGQEIKAIRLALESAFPTVARLTVMVREELNEELAAIAAGQDLTEVVFGLIIWADAKGRVQELIAGAHSNKPNDPALLELEETIETIRAVEMSDDDKESLIKMVARERLEELRPPVHTALPVQPGIEAISSPSSISTDEPGQEPEPLEVEVRVGDVSVRAVLPLGAQTEFALALGSDVEAVLRMRRKG